MSRQADSIQATDLARDTNAVLRRVRSSKRPLVITQRGRSLSRGSTETLAVLREAAAKLYGVPAIARGRRGPAVAARV